MVVSFKQIWDWCVPMSLLVTRASLLVARTLLGAPGIATSNSIATRNKKLLVTDAFQFSVCKVWHRCSWNTGPSAASLWETMFISKWHALKCYIHKPGTPNPCEPIGPNKRIMPYNKVPEDWETLGNENLTEELRVLILIVSHKTISWILSPCKQLYRTDLLETHGPRAASINFLSTLGGKN